MKLTTSQTTAFLQNLPAEIRLVLLYGPDNGLVRERADALARKAVPDINDPFRTVTLAAATLADDPARLYDEMASLALGGGKRLIRIASITDSAAATISKLLADLPATDSLLLLEAGDLDKRSKLRASIETAPQAAAIPCYIEEGATRQRIVADILKSHGAAISADALAFLCDILPPDRIALRSELDKLALYALRDPQHPDTLARPITIEDVQAIMQDAGSAELDDLLQAIGSGNAGLAATLIDRLIDEQTAPVAILRAAQRYFLRLQWARHQMESGLSAMEAVKKLQPPVFWKQADAMASQLRRWSPLKIAAALNRLFDAEAAVKRTGTPDTTLCAQLLLQMAG